MCFFFMSGFRPLFLSLLVFEGGASEEFAQEGGGGDAFLADWQEVAQEFAQAVGLAVFGHVARHLAQDLLGVVFHHAELE